MSLEGQSKVNITMDNSSSYIKVDEKMQSKVFLAFGIFTVTFLVGFFVLLIMLLSFRNPTVINNVTTEVAEGPSYQKNYTRGLKFTMEDGVEHYETITSQGDVMNIYDEADGFAATFDYTKNILMVKNLTSKRCFFSRLSYIPNMRVDDMDNLRPFYCQEYQNGTEVSIPDPNMELTTFVQADVIPYEYILLTNDMSVAQQCADGLSYWLNVKGHARNRRAITLSTVIFGIQIEITFDW